MLPYKRSELLPRLDDGRVIHDSEAHSHDDRVFSPVHLRIFAARFLADRFRMASGFNDRTMTDDTRSALIAGSVCGKRRR